MAQQHHGPGGQGNGSETTTKRPVETTDCGMFDSLGKKEEKPQEDEIMAEKKEEEKPTLLEELHWSHSDSISLNFPSIIGSSDEKEERIKTRKNKKGLKEKMSCEKEEEATENKSVSIPVEKCEENGNAEATQPAEKKGFLDKIIEKLPGQHKKPEEGTPVALPSVLKMEILLV
ncbi:hypothetical protein F0562_020953 [Nyssa sinensis]|uniref:Dehydrin n=1 Tax=Nyssa sinensis TaxID=561372 RepID=A0A5J5BSU3_9ASTE|nr:hypothetical protein F0562_020953 [Nyssa sinensis]